MYGKGFLGNMTENLHADCVQSRQAGFMQCFPYNRGTVPASSLCVSFTAIFSFHLFFTDTLQKKLYKTTKICYTVLNVLVIRNVKGTLHVRPQSGMLFYVS